MKPMTHANDKQPKGQPHHGNPEEPKETKRRQERNKRKKAAKK